MRTSLDFNDALLIEAKRIALEQHSSLKAVVEDALRAFITAKRQQQQVTPVWPVCTEAQPVPEADMSSTQALMDLTDQP